ncbi:MAG: AAA family ATPase [Defluviitaleaceae bacterium]|nr:AAA family ATPase [Defluviitaleaceae bacterium]
MKVKRYEGKSEAALMPVIIEEMGEGATIISVKQKPTTGFFAFFRKPSVIITAACEDDLELINLISNSEAQAAQNPKPFKERKPISVDLAESKNNSSAALEESMEMVLQKARQAATIIENEESKKQKTEIPEEKKQDEKNKIKNENQKYANETVQLFYDTMLEQEVLPEVASYILRDLEDVDEKSTVDVKILIKAIYTSIVDILKGPTLIDTKKGETKKGETKKGESQVVVFMGPTGVGKTTTIAKISSTLTLQHFMKVGLITADTYRIAAVEQLKTYADILGLDIRVVYNPNEMEDHLNALRAKCDIVLIDTAGRSHKHAESMAELKTLLDAIPDCKKYLVVSVTTRYSDLCKIVNVFEQQTDFNLIFTKLDEADTLGSLMNICCLAKKKAAYVTFGQNVPDDLEAIKPDKVAKSLLGLVDAAAHPYTESGQKP